MNPGSSTCRSASALGSGSRRRKSCGRTGRKTVPGCFNQREILAILDHATINGKAMILLGVNAAFGNTDIALLPIGAIDLKAGSSTSPGARPPRLRVVPLWPETVAALRDVLGHRPEPIDAADGDKLFIRVRSRDSYVGDRKGVRVHAEIRRAWRKPRSPAGRSTIFAEPSKPSPKRPGPTGRPGRHGARRGDERYVGRLSAGS